MEKTFEVIVVGGGFAGVAAVRALGRAGVEVLLIDQNNYHQFQPLLYQVATAQIGVSDVTRTFRGMFQRYRSATVLTARVAAVDVQAHTVTTSDGDTFHAQILVLAAGAEANYFNTPGAEENAYPLYSVTDAVRLGNALVHALDAAQRQGSGSGGVHVVVVGGGPTGVETAGAIAENFKYVVPKYFSNDVAARSSVHLVDMVPSVLTPFSDRNKAYATRRLRQAGVRLKMGSGVTEVRRDGVDFADGASLPSQIVVWAGGLKAGTLIAQSGLPQGRGGRIDVNPDLTAPGTTGVYVLGDAANMTDSRGEKLPQLGSCAQQAGKWAARNILADLKGGRRKPFAYLDKGYMAMIGRGAAVAEIGRKRWQIQGPLAFLAWLAVHVVLLSGKRQRVSALISWADDYLTHSRSHVVLGGPDRG
ncbi:NAD(P)/FAD-dependent oxidoreductase [Arthrobacter wenxiniae]|jgi:NADH dehydrogenase|uniref:NAD(P)/FAD-dependent oxidoreductase n=1 Tax=Arthrobacter wenxiniae TaxID=2713570 RepID=A0A7Y7IG82_9MICC|nr:NAD(P)/FAD-dependent oxidoreductase [Arthrobacter wenxiniae]NVM94924.1 NAD(P)/FAD-dependent oxidoreductase [Arthrobacter wenxiniae]